MNRALAGVAVGALLWGCGGTGLTGLTADELDVVARNGRGSNQVQALADVTDSMFSFDPTLDPTKTDVQNAQAIQAQAMVSLNGCGSATLNVTTVTVDFGTGCTLKNGAVVSGTAAFGVWSVAGSVNVTVKFSMLQVNSQSLDGTVVFGTSNGTVFTAGGTLTTSDGTFGVDLTFTGTATSITTSGTFTENGPMATKSAYTFSSVVWNRADCYPSSGTLKITRGLLTSTITFDAPTATTGTVSVAVGKKTSTSTLPAYGSCP